MGDRDEPPPLPGRVEVPGALAPDVGHAGVVVDVAAAASDHHAGSQIDELVVLHLEEVHFQDHYLEVSWTYRQ